MKPNMWLERYTPQNQKNLSDIDKKETLMDFDRLMRSDSNKGLSTRLLITLGNIYNFRIILK